MPGTAMPALGQCLCSGESGSEGLDGWVGCVCWLGVAGPWLVEWGGRGWLGGLHGVLLHGREGSGWGGGMISGGWHAMGTLGLRSIFVEVIVPDEHGLLTRACFGIIGPGADDEHCSHSLRLALTRAD